MYPIRLSTCNLHGKNNGAGISALITNINLRQFVLSIPISQYYRSQSDCWLEAGGVCLGPLSIDAALALPRPEYRELQDNFLKFHDRKSHRLWFLWSAGEFPGPTDRQGKCGCLGNCNFFGLNRNGPAFFKPSEVDFTNSYATAVFHICQDEESLGYGESLLTRKQLMFTRIPCSSFLSTPTRHFLQRKGAAGESSSNTTVTPASTDSSAAVAAAAPFDDVLTDVAECPYRESSHAFPGQSKQHSWDDSYSTSSDVVVNHGDPAVPVTTAAEVHRRPADLPIHQPLTGQSPPNLVSKRFPRALDLIVINRVVMFRKEIISGLDVATIIAFNFVP